MTKQEQIDDIYSKIDELLNESLNDKIAVLASTIAPILDDNIFSAFGNNENENCINITGLYEGETASISCRLTHLDDIALSDYDTRFNHNIPQKPLIDKVYTIYFDFSENAFSNNGTLRPYFRDLGGNINPNHLSFLDGSAFLDITFQIIDIDKPSDTQILVRDLTLPKSFYYLNDDPLDMQLSIAKIKYKQLLDLDSDNGIYAIQTCVLNHIAKITGIPFNKQLNTKTDIEIGFNQLSNMKRIIINWMNQINTTQLRTHIMLQNAYKTIIKDILPSCCNCTDNPVFQTFIYSNDEIMIELSISSKKYGEDELMPIDADDKIFLFTFTVRDGISYEILYKFEKIYENGYDIPPQFYNDDPAYDVTQYTHNVYPARLLITSKYEIRVYYPKGTLKERLDLSRTLLDLTPTLIKNIDNIAEQYRANTW